MVKTALKGNIWLYGIHMKGLAASRLSVRSVDHGSCRLRDCFVFGEAVRSLQMPPQALRLCVSIFISRTWFPL